MLDDSYTYFKTCELSLVRHKKNGPVNFPIFDGSPRQGTWRLAEAILASIGMNEAGDDTAPGTAMFVGRDLGPMLSYLANILGETRLFGLMDNVHVVDHARNYLREQDLVLRVPVFAGQVSDPNSYRIMQSIPFLCSVETILASADIEKVLAILSEKMPSNAVLWVSGYFPAKVVHKDKERLLLDKALAHAGLLHSQLHGSADWEKLFSQAGFDLIDQASTVEGRIEDLSTRLRLFTRRLEGLFRKPFPDAENTWSGEAALRKALSYGLINYAWMQFRKS